MTICCRSECAEPRYLTHAYCLDHKREYGRGWAKTEKGKRSGTAGYVKRTFGITLEEYESLIQDSPCAICGEVRPPFGNRSSMYLDHDHKTGRVRGVLCHQCNTGIGVFKDSPELLRAAIEYLDGPNA
jgi:hypothetical protein